MKIAATSLLIIGAALVFSACNNTAQLTGTTSTTAQTAPITATPTPAPTKPETLNDLKGQLNATVDDGGAADVLSLQTESQGL